MTRNKYNWTDRPQPKATPKPSKPPATVHISNDALNLLDDLARHLGVSQAEANEIAIRTLAQQEGLTT